MYNVLFEILEEAYSHIITEYTESEARPLLTTDASSAVCLFVCLSACMFVCMCAPSVSVCVCAGEKHYLVFSSTMRQWAVQSSSLFSNMVRHLIDRDDLFDDMVNKLIVRLDL